MTEKKIATPEIARACWEAIDEPSCRRVEEKLKAAGYVTPSYRTIATWAKQGGWPVPAKKPAAYTPPRRARRRLSDAAPVLTGDPTSTPEEIVASAEEIVAPPPPPPPPADDGAASGPSQNTGVTDPAREEYEEARQRLRDLRRAITGPEATDEFLLSESARQSLRAAIVISALLAEMAPELIAANPEGVGKLQLAVSQSLAASADPFDRVGAARERAMKTIGGGTVIEPGRGDPLADQIVAFKSRHAA